MFRSIAATEEGKDTKENGTVPKSPKAVSLEDILNDDGDTVLWTQLAPLSLLSAVWAETARKRVAV